MFGSIVVEVLEDAIKISNNNATADKFITFSISTSTQSSELFSQMTDATEEERELDGMLLISKFYNKQLFTAERPNRVIADSAMSFDYVPAELERPKELQNVYWLRHTDRSCISTTHIYKRHRSAASEANRAQRREEHQKGKGFGQKGKGKGKPDESRYTGKGSY